MKKFFLFCLCVTLVFVACKQESDSAATDPTAAVAALTENAASPDLPNPESKKDVSYAFGVSLGHSFRDIGVELDYAALVKGIRDVIDGRETKFSLEASQTAIQSAVMASESKKSEENRTIEEQFLRENGARAGITTTASGLQYEVLSQGSGAKPSAASTVRVDYVGSLTNNVVFDSSVERGVPVDIPLDQVIPGWTEGIQLMNVGSKYRFWIPSALGYGPEGAPGVIPPYSTLIFEVDLLEILPAAQQ